MKYISFLSLLKSEYFKARYNSGVWLMLFFPLLITTGINIYIYIKADHAILDSTIIFDYNPWQFILGRYTFQLYSMLYPIISSILCYSLCDMEYKNNGFKLLFTLPTNKRMIYTSKLIVLFEIIFLSICIAYLLFLFSGYLMSYFLPGYGFQDYDVRKIILIYFSSLYIGIIAICMIQYTLSLLFKSFVLPIGIGCMGTMFCLIAQRWQYIDYVPYNIGWKAFNGFFSELNFNFEYTNIVYILVFIVIGYYLFQRIRT
uniref:ABC transporter permease n=1 Tax=uncultured Dysgonomonas sp. TaxID=206096 RepID=UPI002622E03F|nr:ABC transporter permease [uncultured Dysgonomonas sp.]